MKLLLTIDRENEPNTLTHQYLSVPQGICDLP